MAAKGKYIDDSLVDNWSDAGITSDADKQTVIDRIEEQVEKLTHDYFYSKDFSITLDGNGKSRLSLGLIPDILSISSVKISDITLASAFYAYDKNTIFRTATTTGQCKSINGITLSGSNPISLEITAHGFISGENIKLISIAGITPSLDGEYVITKVDANNLTLNGTDSSDFTGTFTSGTACFASLAEFHYQGLTTKGLFPAGIENIAIVGKYGHNTCPEQIKKATIVLCRASNDSTLYTHYADMESEKLGDYAYNRGNRKFLTGILEADSLLTPFIRKKILLGAI